MSYLILSHTMLRSFIETLLAMINFRTDFEKKQLHQKHGVGLALPKKQKQENDIILFIFLTTITPRNSPENRYFGNLSRFGTNCWPKFTK